MKLKYYLLCFVCFIFTLGCSSTSTEEQKVDLTISAAASLKDALEEIKKQYEQENEVNLHLNFAASGTLGKQIEQGAPVDIFLSADEETFTNLVNKNLIYKNEAIHFLKNELVLIAPKGSKLTSIEDIKKVDKLAIGIPETVPAGRYAKEAFINLELWQQIENGVIFAKDVRQVLSYVETGNVSAGVVYKTDAYISDKIKRISTIDSSLHTPIVYPIGVIHTSKHKNEAIDFYHFLQDENAMSIFKKYGFNVVD
ncbi:molybdate ABC transporter substrate-binding protein [Metabacillus bambusae]|uniref:Molybdate ABC transporter substrate-binding protein n=1 Tax=Metabacillus bambusae TaxID=2795218 RepID=A0ABS3N968_9BACI|nr:molybdate ABC transporter substrate-binding protein [Metabacillus bambusae]MBO1514586.1 molybdate ABC transporter substrate-binding protein [Metabacillus bambusae]